MTEARLHVPVKWPTAAEKFAAEQLRAVGDDLSDRAVKAQDAGHAEESDGLFTGSSVAYGRARELDANFPVRRWIHLHSCEAYALSHLMDEHTDASFGSSWRRGDVVCIDWVRMLLVMHAYPGHMVEAIGWHTQFAGASTEFTSIIAKVDKCWEDKLRRIGS